MRRGPGGPSFPGMTRPLQQAGQPAIALLAVALVTLAQAALYQAWANPGGVRLAPGCTALLPRCREATSTRSSTLPAPSSTYLSPTAATSTAQAALPFGVGESE